MKIAELHQTELPVRPAQLQESDPAKQTGNVVIQQLPDADRDTADKATETQLPVHQIVVSEALHDRSDASTEPLSEVIDTQLDAPETFVPTIHTIQELIPSTAASTEIQDAVGPPLTAEDTLPAHEDAASGPAEITEADELSADTEETAELAGIAIDESVETPDIQPASDVLEMPSTPEYGAEVPAIDALRPDDDTTSEGITEASELPGLSPASLLMDRLVEFGPGEPLDLTDGGSPDIAGHESPLSDNPEPSSEMTSYEPSFAAVLQEKVQTRVESDPAMAPELTALYDRIMETACVIPLQATQEAAVELAADPATADKLAFLETACRRMLVCLGEDSSDDQVRLFMQQVTEPGGQPEQAAEPSGWPAWIDGTRELKVFSLDGFKKLSAATQPLIHILLGSLAMSPIAGRADSSERTHLVSLES